MEIERMREFIRFADTMNFTEAAASLHMSQPNLSKHIRDCERELGVELVDRGMLGAPNTLTRAGEHFLAAARRFVESYDAMVAECRAIQAGERVPEGEAGAESADGGKIPSDADETSTTSR